MKHLPALMRKWQRKLTNQSVFGGLDLRAGASDGAISHMKNLAGDIYPMAGLRQKRYIFGEGEEYLGLSSSGSRLLFIRKEGSGGSLWCGGVKVNGVTLNSRSKHIAVYGRSILLVDRFEEGYTGTYEKLSVTLDESGNLLSQAPLAYSEGHSGITVTGGSLAVVNTPESPSTDSFGCIAGDMLTITVNGNRVNATVSSVTDDGQTLLFPGGTFTAPLCGENAEVTLEKYFPTPEIMFIHEDRIWCSQGNVISASHSLDGETPVQFGIPGTADVYSETVHRSGRLTGGIAYDGYPVFFSESLICPVYGGSPSDFRVMARSVPGVSDGCGETLCEVGGKLYYLSGSGVYRYTSGAPVPVSETLGKINCTSAAAGGDGRKYYLSVKNTDTDLYVYDTLLNLWHREDDREAVHFVNCGLNLYATDGFELFTVGGAAVDERYFSGDDCEAGDLAWELWFAPIFGGTVLPRSPGEVLLRIELASGAAASLTAEYSDSHSETKSVENAGDGRMRVYTVPLALRSCNSLRLKLSGSGGFRLHMLSVLTVGKAEVY